MGRPLKASTLEKMELKATTLDGEVTLGKQVGYNYNVGGIFGCWQSGGSGLLLFENNEIFPERVNTEFIQVIDSKTLKMRVWERGSGETWACGTGACASAVAACLNGFAKEGDEITVKLLGGDLKIVYKDGKVTMTGAAETVFEGCVEV